MPLYEHVFLARQDLTAQQVEGMVEQFQGVIQAGGGTIEKAEMWGVKSLAYRLKKNRKAHFTMLGINAPPAAVAEMERQMRISEDILRFMTLKVEEIEEAPSVMMQKRDRDERKDRERRRRDEEGYGYGARTRAREFKTWRRLVAQVPAGRRWRRPSARSCAAYRAAWCWMPPALLAVACTLVGVGVAPLLGLALAGALTVLWRRRGVAT
ncbi:30S ribosomal protein S6 [Micromonospora sp. STR1s_5]|nr:30S ribosomal protein S6 [Micromonospora sp. STR1s_5]